MVIWGPRQLCTIISSDKGKTEKVKRSQSGSDRPGRFPCSALEGGGATAALA